MHLLRCLGTVNRCTDRGRVIDTLGRGTRAVLYDYLGQTLDSRAWKLAILCTVAY